MIREEQATVYRGGGRRWFTKKAAINAEARKVIRAKCECDAGSPEIGIPPEICRYHCSDRYPKIMRRLTMLISAKAFA